jgi:hypothetical protein
MFDEWELDHKPVANSTEKLTFIASNQTHLSANFKKAIPSPPMTFIFAFVIIVIIITTAVLHVIENKNYRKDSSFSNF